MSKRWERIRVSVYFDNRQNIKEITDELMESLEHVVDIALQTEGIHLPVEVSISFVDNHEIQQLNREYRDKDQPTDVLSFPLVDREQLEGGQAYGEMLLGDIIISIPRAQEQAIEYGHSFLREMAYLTVHGMFHLMGYDHMEPEEKAIMRKKEEQVMKEVNITRDPS